MTRAIVLRCPARHPADPSRECRAKLADIIPGSVEVRSGEMAPGCVGLRCSRCGAEYLICPKDRAA